MPRNRMIKTEFWDDQKLAIISRDARLTYIALWNFSDDYGVVKGHHAWLKNNIYPYDEKLGIDTFKKWLLELETLKRILPFSQNGELYYYLPKFLTHQTINRPSLQRNPEPPDNILEDSMNTHGVLMDEKKLSIKEKKGNKNKKFIPPSLDDVVSYFKENGYGADIAERAYKGYNVADWHDSKGNKIKNWKQKMFWVWFKPENKQKPNKNSSDAFAV